MTDLKIGHYKNIGVVGLGRFELPTYGLGNRRSIHLSYSPASLILQLNGKFPRKLGIKMGG